MTNQMENKLGEMLAVIDRREGLLSNRGKMLCCRFLEYRELFCRECSLSKEEVRMHLRMLRIVERGIRE